MCVLRKFMYIDIWVGKWYGSPQFLGPSQSLPKIWVWWCETWCCTPTPENMFAESQFDRRSGFLQSPGFYGGLMGFYGILMGFIVI